MKLSRVRRTIRLADWKDLSPRLCLVARFRMGGRPTIGGLSPEDFVQEAVTKAYSGTRRWHKSVGEFDLYAFLCGIIRSEVNHALEREMRFRRLFLES